MFALDKRINIFLFGRYPVEIMKKLVFGSTIRRLFISEQPLSKSRPMSATWQIVWSHGLLNIYAMYLKEVEKPYVQVSGQSTERNEGALMKKKCQLIMR